VSIQTTTLATPGITSDAIFRTWGSAVSALIQAAGLTKTSDTGQVNWTTVTRAAGGTASGYEMYRFPDADPLQASRPVFIKIEYGIYQSNSSWPELWVSVGNATNGAGTLVAHADFPDFTVSRQSSTTSEWLASSTPTFCEAAYLDGEFLLVLHPVNSTNNHGMWWWISRTRDVDGVAVGDGLAIARGNFDSDGGNTNSTFRHFYGSTVGQMSTTWLGSTGFVPLVNTLWPSANATAGGDTYLAPWLTGLPMRRTFGPAKLLQGCWRGGIALGTTVALTHLGEAGTWRGMGTITGYAGHTQSQTNVGMAIRSA
jgi:hypothetical protein